MTHTIRRTLIFGLPAYIGYILLVKFYEGANALNIAPGVVLVFCAAASIWVWVQILWQWTLDFDGVSAVKLQAIILAVAAVAFLPILIAGISPYR